MSETLTVLKTRRSCRAYKPELIEEEKLTTFTECNFTDIRRNSNEQSK